MDKRIITFLAVYVLISALLFINYSMSYILIIILLSVFSFYYFVIEKDIQKDRLNKEAYTLINLYIYYRFTLKDQDYLKLCLKNLSKNTQKQLLNFNNEKEILFFLKDLYQDSIFNKFILLLNEKKVNLDAITNMGNYVSFNSTFNDNRLCNFENRLVSILIFDALIYLFHYLTINTIDTLIKNQIFYILIIFYVLQLTLLFIEYLLNSGRVNKNNKSFLKEYLLNLLFLSHNLCFGECEKLFKQSSKDYLLMGIFKNKDKGKLVEYYNNENDDKTKEIILFAFKNCYLNNPQNEDYEIAIKHLNYINLKRNTYDKYYKLGQILLFGLLFIIQFYMMVTYGI